MELLLTLPNASTVLTPTLNSAPETRGSAGWAVSTRAAGAAAVMLTVAVVSGVSAGLVKTSLYVPTAVSARSENVATPFTAARVSVPPTVGSVVPASATLTSPVNVVATFPKASRTSTTMAGAIVTPAIAADGCDAMTSCDGVLAIPVAAIASGEPLSPPAAAVMACAPNVVPSVHRVDALPFTSVVSAVALKAPPPLATAKVTTTPCAGSPSLARVRTTTESVSAVPTAAVCAPPEARTNCEAGNATVNVAVSALRPLGSAATMRAVPRTGSHVATPVAPPTCTRVESSVKNTNGVLAIA